jgi:hypothetical protein
MAPNTPIFVGVFFPVDFPFTLKHSIEYTIAMESILKSDIFFFVTTICICAITALILMILSNILYIVKKFRKYVDLVGKQVDRVSDEADGFHNDLSALRSSLRESQFGLKPVFDAVRTRAEAFAGKPRARRSPKAAPDQNV